jgi:hypothetical protein
MSDTNNPTPQFSTAEYPEAPGRDSCVACKQPITSRYYRVNGKMACESCTERVRREAPQDSHANYVRGVLFGVGAAIVGMILYAGFTIVTGFYIGYVSLAVGWLVGKAIMVGSKGFGGRRYQIAALLLTYAAVSIAAVPIAISYQIKEKRASQGSQERVVNLAPPQGADHSAGEQPPASDSAAQQKEQPTVDSQAEPKMGMVAALAQLLWIGLASPFLELQDPFHGIIGLIILLVGIRIAWRITQGSGKMDIQGPYDNTPAAPVMR